MRFYVLSPVLAAAVLGLSATAADAAPRPVLEKVVIVSPVRGHVSVEQPHKHKFVVVSRYVALQTGGVIDASAGTAAVETAAHGHRATATGQFSGGIVRVTQQSPWRTTLKLTAALKCPGAHGRTLTLVSPVRQAFALADTYATTTAYVKPPAPIQSARWTTADTCTGSTITPTSGTVTVTSPDLTQSPTTLAAGHSVTVPAPGAAAADFTWTSPEPISNGGAFAAVSCAPSGFCAAVNANGDVVTSTSPATPTAWTTTALTSDSGLNGISCPTAQFCVATDGQSDILYVSSDPAAGASAWTPVKPSNSGLSGISCVSSSLCVAVGGADTVVSTDPTGGSAAWQDVSVAPGQQLTSVSCVTGVCVAVGTVIATSTTPTGGAGSWLSSTSLGGDGVSCVSTQLCVIAGDNGDVDVSTNPTAGPSTYANTGIDPLHPLQPSQSVSCIATGPCVVVGASGDAITTLDPGGSARAWTATTIDPASGLTGVSCVSATECVAVDSAGDALIGTRP